MIRYKTSQYLHGYHVCLKEIWKIIPWVLVCADICEQVWMGSCRLNEVREGITSIIEVQVQRFISTIVDN